MAFALALAAATTLLAAPSHADGKKFKATLSGKHEVPDARKTPAEGDLQLVLSEDGQQLTYKLTVRGISNPVFANIHLGAAFANGPPVLTLYPNDKNPQKSSGPVDGVLAEGVLTAADLLGPMTGGTLQELAEEMDANNTYVNVHTDDGVEPINSGPGDYPNGEIRGPIR
jgi:hypothetical protein